MALSKNPRVWIYVVLTLIQTLARNSSNPASLDICRINSYSNCCRLESDVGKIWIYAVLTLIQTQLLNTIRGVWIYAVLTLIQTGRWSRRHACSLDICRINSYSNSHCRNNILQKVWIYAVLTLFKLVSPRGSSRIVWIYAVLTLFKLWSACPSCFCLDICRINSYSNFFLVRPLFQRLDICRINSYSNSHHSLAVLTVFGYMPY